MSTKPLIEPGSIHRGNLREAAEVALEYGLDVQKKRPLSGWDAQYTQLALEALQIIARQLAKPASERDPKPTSFSATFVRAEPDVDRQLVDLVAKIEDVYRRWYCNIGQ